MLAKSHLFKAQHSCSLAQHFELDVPASDMTALQFQSDYDIAHVPRIGTQYLQYLIISRIE